VGNIVSGIFQGLTDLIGSAERLGTLSAAAIWAFFTLILIGYVFYSKRQESKISEIRLGVRLKDVEADILMSKAIESGLSKVADELKEVRHEIERIGGNHV